MASAPGSHVRRNFLKQVIRDGTRAAVEGAETVRAGRESALRALTEPATDRALSAASTDWPWASPGAGLDPADLDALVARSGLETHIDAIGRLVRPGLRLTPGAGRRARKPSAGEVSVHIAAEDAAFIGLPKNGTLRFVLGRDSDAAVVEFEPDSRNSGEFAFGRPLEVSRELQLPRGWSALVDELGLSFDERELWETLRIEVARAQRLDPLDGSGRSHRLGRILGYPDDRSGSMPSRCEAATTEGPAATASDAELAQRWRLLFQFPLPLTRGTSNDRRSTLFVWIRQEDLKAMDFSTVQTIVL